MSASPYAELIDSARDTIVQRARLYKRLVIGVSLGSLLVIGLALGLRSLLPLLGWLLLPTLVLLHRGLDLRAVHRWRMQAVQRWADGRVQLDLLARTLRSVPALPAATVEGMLESLPPWRTPAPPESIRHACAQAQQRLGLAAETALQLRALAWTVAASAVVLAWRTGQLPWLAGLPLALLLPAAWRAWARRRLRQALEPLRAPADSAGQRLAELNWQGVPAALSRGWVGDPPAAPAASEAVNESGAPEQAVPNRPK